MTSAGTKARRHEGTEGWWVGRSFLLIALASLLCGCSAAPRNIEAIRDYYDYRFSEAAAALAPEAEVNDEQVLLNSARAGLAALADGDSRHAERRLRAAFDLLSTAGLNKDRTTAAAVIYEGVRIWKGEPFEQALMYYWTGVLYGTLGDYENMRAAAANSLFRLADFGRDQRTGAESEQGASDGAQGDADYTAVDSDFALGFLTQAIGADLSGAGGSAEQFAAAVKIDPELATLVDVLRERRYDTLLLIDWGKGPTKTAYGSDDSLVRFEPQERRGGALSASAANQPLWRAEAVCDVDRMARDLRWNSLEEVRRAKSTLGDIFVLGGAGSLAYGAADGSAEAAIAGVGAILAGLLLKNSAQADTRYLEFAPARIYLVPLLLQSSQDVAISIENTPSSRIVLPRLAPGTPQRPRIVYLRLHGRGSPSPAWLTADGPLPEDVEPLPGPGAVAPADAAGVGSLPWSTGWKRRAYEGR